MQKGENSDLVRNINVPSIRLARFPSLGTGLIKWASGQSDLFCLNSVNSANLCESRQRRTKLREDGEGVTTIPYGSRTKWFEAQSLSVERMKWSDLIGDYKKGRNNESTRNMRCTAKFKASANTTTIQSSLVRWVCGTAA